jgi:hypothetical protein
MRTQDERKPYDRQPGEGSKAFEAFAHYRDSGEDRSIVATARHFGKFISTFKTWAWKFHWKDRIFAWETELDRQRQRAQIKGIQEMNTRHITLAFSVLGEVAGQLQKMQARRSKIDELTPLEMARLLEVAVKVERQARGESSTSIDVRIREMEEQFSRMTPEQVMLYGRKLFLLDGETDEPAEEPIDVELRQVDEDEEEYEDDDAA